MRSSGLLTFAFSLAVLSVPMANASSGSDLFEAERTSNDRDFSGTDTISSEINDRDPALYDWVFLKCLHDSAAKKQCPQVAGAKGYKWSMLKATCGRSYWGCYGSM